VFTGGVADALNDVATGAKSVEDAFSDMAKTILSALARIAAQRLHRHDHPRHWNTSL